MTTVYKYQLKLVDTQTVSMPDGAEILTVENQGDTLCLWALVNLKEPTVDRYIQIVGTGNPVQGDVVNLVYLGTVHRHHGVFVWHVFEEIV